MNLSNFTQVFTIFPLHRGIFVGKIDLNHFLLLILAALYAHYRGLSINILGLDKIVLFCYFISD